MQRTHRRFIPPIPLLVLTALIFSSSVAFAQPAEEAPAEPEAAPEAPAPAPEPAPEPAAEPEPEPEAELEPEPAAKPSPVAVPSPLPVDEPTAPPKKPSLVMSPSFFNRYELRRNYATVGKTAGRFSDFDAMAYRARLKFELKDISVGKHSSLDIVLNPQASGFWEQSGAIADTYDLRLHEGYMLAHFGSGHSFQLGRFEMAYGDQWLIGPVGWHQTGRTFDGIRQHLSFGKAWVDLLGIWLRDGEQDGLNGGADRVHDGDAFLLGAYSDIGGLIMEGMNLDIYALMHIWARTDDLPDGMGGALPQSPAAAELTLGGRAKASYGKLDYRLEGGLQAGKRGGGGGSPPSVLAGAVDLEVGFKVHPRLRMAVEGFLYSGDDPTTSKNEGWVDRYSTAHKWNGWADVMLPRTDQAGGVFHIVANATEDLKVGAITHVFARPEPFGPQAKGFNGAEIDLFAVQPLMPGLALRVDYDIFLPVEDAYGPAAEPVHYLGIELRYQGAATFGG